MKTVEYKIDPSVPVIASVEICVVGAGPGGLGAAVTAARAGRDVLVVERFSAPGGMAVWGEVTPFMPNHINDKPIDGPVYKEWVAAMSKYHKSSNHARVIEKDSAMLAAEELILDSGAKLLYHHTLVDVLTCDGKVTCAIFQSKSGLVAVEAKVFIDSTGDGDLAALAGAEVEYGNDENLCQPMTLCFKLENVDVANMPSRPDITQLYLDAKARGELNNPREDVLWFFTSEEDVIHFNTTRVIKKSALSGVELSEAEIEARQQVRELFQFFRKNVPGYENATIRSIAHHIGIRESRRIMGMDYLTAEVFENRQKFPDSIAKARYPVDIHNPSGTGTILKYMPAGEWYEISYGTIVVKGFDNLLIASRCISVDHELHSSMRVMPIVITIGQGAGMAAAISIESDTTPAQLSGIDVHNRLIKFGADL